MHLIVGLGNPGASYAGHRHNIGAMAVDAIAKHHAIGPFRNKFSGLLADGSINTHRVLLLKPQTFMNKSGDSVQAAASFYKIPPESITIIYDDLDLAPGKVRVKTGGGNGGHNGLRSIDPRIGTGYQRVRLGIGHPGHKELVNRHVLSDFHKLDFEWLDPLLEAISLNAGLLVEGNAANFMNKMALALQKADEAILEKEAREKSRTEKPKVQPPADNQTTGSTGTPGKTPDEGPLAGMLKKLFQKDT